MNYLLSWFGCFWWTRGRCRLLKIINAFIGRRIRPSLPAEAPPKTRFIFNFCHLKNFYLKFISISYQFLEKFKSILMDFLRYLKTISFSFLFLSMIFKKIIFSYFFNAFWTQKLRKKRQLPTGVTRVCLVELQGRERLAHILGLGEVKALSGPSPRLGQARGPSAAARTDSLFSCNSTRHVRINFFAPFQNKRAKADFLSLSWR